VTAEQSDHSSSRPEFQHLRRGTSYVVAEPFTDYDGVLHPRGERWDYIGSNFLPYDDGLSLFARIGGALRHIRLQWTAEAQGAIIDGLERHLVAGDP
jgi:hypothetical protein